MRLGFLARLTSALAIVLLTMTFGSPCGAAEKFLPQLTAFELSSDQVRPGETIWATYEFVNTGTAPASGECTVFVHLRPAKARDPDARPATGADFRPFTPTFLWFPNRLVRQPPQPITIPPDFPPGRYRIWIGLSDPNAGVRYELANADLAGAGRRYQVAELDVLPKDKTPAGKPVKGRWRDTNGLALAEEPIVHPPHGQLIHLENAALRVSLSAAMPVLHRYELRSGKSLSGDLSGYPLRVRLGRTDSDKFQMVLLADPQLVSLKQQGPEARYTVQVRQQEQLAAQFDLVFRLQGNTLQVRVEKVQEEPGFLLMDVFLPQLVSTQGPAGQLVIPTQGGRLVPLDRSGPGRHTIAMNWFEMDLCGAVVGNGCGAALRTRDWDNQWEVRVAGVPGHLFGGYAPHLALRASATTKAARIRLASTPAVEVTLLEANEKNPFTWVDLAKWLRRDVTGSPNPLYADTHLYKIFCDSPGAKDYTTFDEALEVIRKVHRLVPWLRQVVYLVGWQYHGHDTGYPATDQINARLGGIEGLRRLAAEARKYNATLSYHDNFDDAYRDSPQWDENLIARDVNGNLQKGGVWAGGQSYILAFKKYAQQAGLARVRRTVSQMPVRDSYHIDVLSAVPMRRDYNLHSPESTGDSLEGKFAILSQFNRLGIDVTSEGFTAPFVGRIGHGWHFWRRDDTVFAGDEPVPFIPMIYHGGPTTYGRGGRRTPYFHQESLLYGASFSTDWTKRTKPQEMAAPLYQIVVPWTHLRHRKMQDYQRQGSLCRVTYASDTFVEVDRSSGHCRTVIDGTPMVENGLVVERRSDLVAVYSPTATTATVRLPPAWAGKKLKVTNACTGEELTAGVRIAADAVTLDVPAGDPLHVQCRD